MHPWKKHTHNEQCNRKSIETAVAIFQAFPTWEKFFFCLDNKIKTRKNSDECIFDIIFVCFS